MFRLIHDGDAARLTLDRPEVRNAIPAAGWAELARLTGEIAASGARLLVVGGAGEAFCAGADLSDFPAFAGDPSASGRFRQAMRAGLDALTGLEIPTVALIDGPCYGAGVALALACDLRIAGPGARFAVPPARLGISYPQEDVHRLVAQIGAGQAARLLFTGETIDGAEAARIGLVELGGRSADEAIAAILASDAESLKVLKRAIALGAGGYRSDAGQDERFDALLGGGAMMRRLDALRRK